LKGPFSDPEVSVNPLSALTPGFLRGLFGLGSGAGGEAGAEGEGVDEDGRPRAFPAIADK
jgi:hypothetical protein